MGPAFDRFIEYARAMTVRDEVERTAWAGPLVEAFNEATQGQMTLPITDQDRTILREWLQRVFMEHDHSTDVQVAVVRSTLSQSFFLTTAEKASFLAQVSCFRCPPDQTSPHSATYPIGVTPISAQSATTDQRALFRARIESAMANTRREMCSDFGDRSLCVTVTSLLAAGERRKDADNLCKALLDELQGFIYENDSTIQHLQSYRFEYRGTFSGHIIHVAGVRADVNADVLDPNVDPTFLSGMPGS